MEISAIEKLIQSDLEDAQVFVEGEGCNFSVTVVSKKFDGSSTVKSQQMVLAAVQDPIATGELHAVTVKTYTPEEWVQK